MVFSKQGTVFVFGIGKPLKKRHMAQVYEGVYTSLFLLVSRSKDAQNEDGRGQYYVDVYLRYPIPQF